VLLDNAFSLIGRSRPVLDGGLKLDSHNGIMAEVQAVSMAGGTSFVVYTEN
jgi:hypothetical protein